MKKNTKFKASNIFFIICLFLEFIFTWKFYAVLTQSLTKAGESPVAEITQKQRTVQRKFTDGGAFFFLGKEDSTAFSIDGSAVSIMNNTASYGGGMWFQTGSFSVGSVSVQSNNATSGLGSAIYLYKGTLSIDGSSATITSTGTTANNIYLAANYFISLKASIDSSHSLLIFPASYPAASVNGQVVIKPDGTNYSTLTQTDCDNCSVYSSSTTYSYYVKLSSNSGVIYQN